jgi:hypothetical protein
MKEEYDFEDMPEVIRAKDLLPWYYRIALWIANHLVLYSVLVATLGFAAGWFLHN